MTDTAELKAHFLVNEGGAWKEIQGADSALGRWHNDGRHGWLRFY